MSDKDERPTSILIQYADGGWKEVVPFLLPGDYDDEAT